jgi:putative hydrolase of the HAD superfamily
MEALKTQPLTNIKIVFFDLDDTLCGYWEASKAALRRTFERYAPEGKTADDMVRHWAVAFREFSPNLKQTGWYESYLRKGEPTRTEQMRLTLLQAGIDDPALAKEIGDVYAEERNLNLQLFSESLEVLEKLKARFPLGLITNGPADIQRQEIATLGIEHYFDYVFIEGEMGRGKPLAVVFEAIATEAGKQPHEILFVGNSYAHDVKPALEAGWHAVWVRRATDVPPSAADQNFPEHRPEGSPLPDAVVHDLREVLTILGM